MDQRPHPLVAVVMGSRSDWETMRHAADALAQLEVPYETRVVSAHRTPDLMFEFAAEAEGRGIEVIIAGAGGAAHLPGMVAAKTVLPVLGVPVESRALRGLDSLLSIIQMPAGVPVGTLAIGRAGAVNAALLAGSMLGARHPSIREAVRAFRAARTDDVLAHPDPSIADSSPDTSISGSSPDTASSETSSSHSPPFESSPPPAPSAADPLPPAP